MNQLDQFLENRRTSGALARKITSESARTICNRYMIPAQSLMLDYGCGHGLDLVLYRSHGIDAHGFDPIHAPNGGKRFVGSYDFVTCTDVLNTLPTEPERMFCVEGILSALKMGGVGIISFHGSPAAAETLIAELFFRRQILSRKVISTKSLQAILFRKEI